MDTLLKDWPYYVKLNIGVHLHSNYMCIDTVGLAFS